MSAAIRKKVMLSAILGLSLLMLLYSACSSSKTYVPKKKALPSKIGKIAVVGFKPAISMGNASGIVRSAVSGAVYMAEPVSRGTVDRMTASLFSRLFKQSGLDLISPGQVRGVFLSIISSNPGMKDMDLFQKIGKIFSADAVLVGYLYRWRERDGTDYSANSPASVAFDLYLISPENKAILWKAKYDKTQKSLSENLFDSDTFFKGGGKWLTAERLAEFALADMLGN